MKTAAPRLSHPTRVWLALGTVYLVWGSTYLAIRVAIDTLPPLLMAAARFLVAGAVLLAIGLPRGDRTGDRIEPRHWRSALIVGGALLLGGNGGVVLAEQRLPSAIAALIIATTPLWMAIIDRRLLGSRLGGRAVAGLLAGFAGVVFLAAPGSGREGIDPFGALTVVGAALAWAAGSIYSQRAPLPHRPLVATGMEMVAGGACLAVAGLVAGEWADLDLRAVTAASAAAVAYLVVFGSIVAFTAYVWLLRSAPISLVGTYAYVNPIVAVVLGWAILGEPVTGRVAVAAAVIVAGVAMIVSARSRVAPREMEVGSPADAPCPPETGTARP